MKQLFAVLLLASIGLSAAGQKQNEKPTLTKAEQEVLELNRAWAEAITKNDPKVLEP